MRHVHAISRTPLKAETSLLEQTILILFGIFFSDWDNYAAVIQNLQKFYAKTPE